jgi:molecular chaperone DnaK
MSLAIGIDLGTARCAVGVYEHGKAAPLLAGKQAFALPSVIGFAEDGSLLVGDRPRRLALTRPQATLFGLRRLLGRRFDELDVQAWRSYALLRAAGGDAHVRVGEVGVSPPELIAPMIREVRDAAERQLGEVIQAGVVAVRGHLDDAQRRATIAACRLGGLEVRRLVHSTTAAALAYQAGRVVHSEELVAVIDFGAGGFDVALIEVGERNIEVLAQRGLAVGGEDLDARVVEWLLAEFAAQTGVDAATDAVVRARMRDVAERTRISLSDAKDAEVHLPYLAADETGPKHLQTRLTQAKLEKMIADLLDRCDGAVQRTIDDSGRSIKDVAHVLLLGGCSRMPVVHGRVETIFKQTPSSAIDHDDTVARGAALFAGQVASRHPERAVHEVLSRPLWLQVGANEPAPLFARKAAVPTEHSEPVTTPGDGRPGPTCRVLEGERVGGEPPTLLSFAVSGRPEVEVKFTLDHNHVLELSIREMLRGKEARLVVEGRGGLEEQVLTTMVEDARAREAEGRLVREANERCQRLEGMIQRAERVAQESKAIAPEIRDSVLVSAHEAATALTTNDDERVTAAIAAFTALLRTLPAELAAIAAPPAPPQRLQPVVATSATAELGGEESEDEGGEDGG